MFFLEETAEVPSLTWRSVKSVSAGLEIHHCRDCEGHLLNLIKSVFIFVEKVVMSTLFYHC